MGDFKSPINNLQFFYNNLKHLLIMKRFYVQYKVVFFALFLAVSLSQRSTAQTDWVSRTSASNDAWKSVAYGNGTFVAVANSAVMTSTDGITWTSRTPAATAEWISVTYGNGLFVAVAKSGTGDRVMSSPDGITWTGHAVTGTARPWIAVTYGNGIFAAISINVGPNFYSLTSSDGSTWTSHTVSGGVTWASVTYGNGLFVAVAQSGTGIRIKTSTDAITWTTQSQPSNSGWRSVTYGNGTFVAVAPQSAAAAPGVMTSTDGVTWTLRTGADNSWRSVTYGNGLFVAVAESGTGNRVMTSPDGITWTSQTSAANNTWASVTHGNGLFVAVSDDGAGNRVMTSVNAVMPVELLDFKGQNTEGGNLLTWTTANEVNNKGFQVERITDNPEHSGWIILGFKTANNKSSTYTFTDNTPLSTSYYRLRQLDNDGKETLSKVISIATKGNNKLKVYPNPVSTVLTLDTEGGDFQIINLLGQQVLTGKGTQQIDVSALPEGTYVLKVGADQGKFIKQ